MMLGISYRILMIAPTPFFADRGCHKRIYEEAKALEKLGNKVIICTYHNGRNIDGVKIERMMNIPWYKKLSAGPSYHKFYLDFLLLLKSIQVASRFKPNIIHSHLHEGAVIGRCLSKLFNIPLIFDYQGSLSQELVEHNFLKEGTLKYEITRYIEKRIDLLADIIFANSKNSSKMLVEEFNINPDKIITISDGTPNSRTISRHDVDCLREKLELPASEIVVYLGLLTKYQGINLLMEAIKEVLSKRNKVHFLIMGYPDEQKYYNMAKGLGISSYITFTGKVNYEEIPYYLALGDIAVSPKLSKTESNDKLFEYMASGLPTVVFDTPVNREILGDLGIYAEYGSSKSFAEKIIEISGYQEKREFISSQLAKRAHNYSWGNSGDRIVEIYKTLSEKC